LSALDRWVRELRPDRRAAAAVAALSKTVDVAAVANDVGLSSRQLRRLLLAEVGLGPKTLQRVARLQYFLALADLDGAGLAALAARAGYADQSHLTREVRDLSGLPPAALLAERAA
jgi:AraC-like DNA-binding protein